MMKRRNKQANL